MVSDDVNQNIPSTEYRGISVRSLWKVFGKNPDELFNSPLRNMEKSTIQRDLNLVVALRDVSFDVTPGETFVVMGLSGSGKSTLVRCLINLIEPTSGSIIVDGQDITQFDQKELRDFRRSKIAMVFQNFGLLPHKNVLDNAAYGLEVKGIEKHERYELAREVLAKVGLEGWETSNQRELSGGMQQRVGLARALAMDPSILLMDEPFSALDPLIRRQLQIEFLKLSKLMKKTTVFITHDLDEAVKVGHRIAIMRDGKVIQVGTPEQIVIKPADEYVADFVKGISRLKVVEAKTIMKSIDEFKKNNGPLQSDVIRMKENEVLSSLIEKSVSKDSPIIITNADGKDIGVISQKDLLVSVVEGQDD